MSANTSPSGTMTKTDERGLSEKAMRAIKLLQLRLVGRDTEGFLEQIVADLQGKIEQAQEALENMKTSEGEPSTLPSQANGAVDRFGLSIEPVPHIAELRTMINDKAAKDLFDELVAGLEATLRQARKEIEDIDRKAGLDLLSAYTKELTISGRSSLVKTADPSSLTQDHDDAATSTATTETSTNTKRLTSHPKIDLMHINVLLLAAAKLIFVSEPVHDGVLASALEDAQAAHDIAARNNDKPAMARCRYYIGHIALRMGSIENAMDHFTEAKGASPVYSEGAWARIATSTFHQELNEESSASEDDGPRLSPTRFSTPKSKRSRPTTPDQALVTDSVVRGPTDVAPSGSRAAPPDDLAAPLSDSAAGQDGVATDADADAVAAMVDESASADSDERLSLADGIDFDPNAGSWRQEISESRPKFQYVSTSIITQSLERSGRESDQGK